VLSDKDSYTYHETCAISYYGDKVMSAVHILMMINGLNKTRLTYDMVLDGVSQKQAQQLRDGPDGWSILEIMCHIRDYQDIYLERVEGMLQEDDPTFKSYDRFELIKQNDYAHQDLRTIFEDYSSTRNRVIELLNSLDDEQWTRKGFYPNDGPESAVFNIALQLLAHDNDHIEQVMRVLKAG
jgi:uncharacterized damage-inducible protein DinB